MVYKNFARRSAVRLLATLTLLLVLMNSCTTTRPVTTTSELVGTANREWLTYQVYRLPTEKSNQPVDKKLATHMYSIRVVNTGDNTSPLRKLSNDLAEYNTYYEYLLNGCKDDISLSGNSGFTAYPVYYAFENNYNAFPFETINVGYTISKKQSREKNMRLVFVDRLFAHDTISISLN